LQDDDDGDTFTAGGGTKPEMAVEVRVATPSNNGIEETQFSETINNETFSGFGNEGL
jgi:hypothetical protein